MPHRTSTPVSLFDLVADAARLCERMKRIGDGSETQQHFLAQARNHAEHMMLDLFEAIGHGEASPLTIDEAAVAAAVAAAWDDNGESDYPCDRAQAHRLRAVANYLATQATAETREAIALVVASVRPAPKSAACAHPQAESQVKH